MIKPAKPTPYYKNKIDFFNKLESYICKDEEIKLFDDLEYWAFKNYGFGNLQLVKALKILEARQIISWNRDTKKILPLVNTSTPTGEEEGGDTLNRVFSASPILSDDKAKEDKDEEWETDPYNDD